jgi:hypothetical protein
MVVAGSTCNELGVEKVIRGHKGNLYVGGRTATLRPERIYADEVEEREIPATTEGDDLDNLRRRFLECVRAREKAPADIELGTKVMVIVDLATRSIWEGAAFGYDPARKKVRKLWRDLRRFAASRWARFEMVQTMGADVRAAKGERRNRGVAPEAGSPPTACSPASTARQRRNQSRSM